MKKYISVVLALCAVFCVLILSSCDMINPWRTETSFTSETEQTAEPTPTQTAAPTAEPTPEPTTEPTPAPDEEEPSIDESEEENEDSSMLPAPEIGSDAFVEDFMNNPIDAQYVEEMEYAASVSAMIYACNTAAESWKDQIDAVYMQILDAADAELAGEIKAEQEEWLSAQNNELKEIRETVESDDVMASVTVAENIMLYYRSRAIDLCAVLYELDGQLVFG